MCQHNLTFSLETNTFLILGISIWSAFRVLRDCYDTNGPSKYIAFTYFMPLYFFRNGVNLILLITNSTKYMKQHYQCGVLKSNDPAISTITRPGFKSKGHDCTSGQFNRRPKFSGPHKRLYKLVPRGEETPWKCCPVHVHRPRGGICVHRDNHYHCWTLPEWKMLEKC